MDKKLKTKGKQGKMDPKKPFDKISKYDSEEESEQDASEIEDRAPSSSASSYSFRSSSSSVIYNILLANLKGKDLLGGVDFCLVMCKKQGKGAKNLKGNELKKHLQWKEQKMIIAKLALAGANVAEMEPFIKSSKVHLTRIMLSLVALLLVFAICYQRFVLWRMWTPVFLPNTSIVGLRI